MYKIEILLFLSFKLRNFKYLFRAPVTMQNTFFMKDILRLFEEEST